MNDVRVLVDKLNKYRDAYYNNNEMLISDKEYDELFDQLKKLEKEWGLIYPDSPTQSVGYVVQSDLKKVKHDHPMLSLDKTKSVDDLVKFHAGQVCVLMNKMDGLTCTLSYDSQGNLVKAESRGNGIEGEDVLENVKCISNIPQHINKGPYTIDGEVIMTYDTFNLLVERFPDKNFKHPRNVASGSLRQLDTKITKERNLKFIAWRVVDGSDCDLMELQLLEAEQLGFTVVPFIVIAHNYKEVFEAAIADLKQEASELNYPIDGLVISYDDIEYGNNLGLTAHHPRHSLAYKFYDDCYETTLRNIEWNTTRTGIIAPIAVFDPVDLDGAITQRATLHNISIMRELELGIGDTITVYRANQVIPKVDDNLTRSNTFEIPSCCPCCGASTEIKKDGIAEVLYCTNEKCSSKLLAQFEHFCSKDALNIEGLSSATLEKFINLGLIKTYADIFHLIEHKNEIINLNGFGVKSFDDLCIAIELARSVKVENLLVGLGIKGVGKAAAKTIAKAFDQNFDKFIYALSNNYDLTQLPDFGQSTADTIYFWYNTEYEKGISAGLNKELMFPEWDNYWTEALKYPFLNQKTFVVTGALNTMTRAAFEDLIYSQGGKVVGSVSKKVDYLVTNETAETTKYKKALDLGIPVLSEAEFLKQAGIV